uniref:Uncharacterized protein n=1 Tax=Romanomermis culicivorax TaxID=13658 RepID=A0A915IU03_ROMCU
MQGGNDGKQIGTRVDSGIREGPDGRTALETHQYFLTNLAVFCSKLQKTEIWKNIFTSIIKYDGRVKLWYSWPINPKKGIL